MANEVKTIFTIDDATALRKIENYKQKLGSVGGLGSPSASASDPAMRKAQADIARYQKQRADGETAYTRLVERQAEQRSRAEIAAFQRQTSAALASFKKIEAEQRRMFAGSGSGGSVLGAPSFSLTALAQGTLVGAAAFGGVKLAQQAIDKAVEQSRANRLIASSATEAGLAQGILADKNKEFAASVGLSNVAAAQTTAMITRLATFSGNSSPARITELLKAFADLGAARGIAGQDLQGLIGTILSGQDEGLNRLGIADPGILQKAYAKKIGVAVTDLTQQQKVTAATAAVLEKAATFAGAAETRMSSLEGQVAKTDAAWGNFTNTLSQSFTTSGPVVDFITEASRLLKELQYDLGNVNAELAKGKSPRQIAEETYGTGYGDYLKSFATGGFGILGILGRTGALGETYRGAVDVSLIRQRGIDARTAQIAAQDAANKQQAAAAAEQGSVSGSFAKTFAAAHTAYLTAYQPIVAAGRETELNASQNFYKVQEAKLDQHLKLQEASEVRSIQQTTNLKNQALRDQIAINTKYFQELINIATEQGDTKKVGELRKDMTEAVSNANAEIVANSISAQTQIQLALKESKKVLKDLFVEFQGRNNPFITIFSEGEKNIKRAMDATKGLSKELRDAAVAAAQADTAAKDFGQTLDSKLQAYGLRSEARQLRAGKIDDPNDISNFQTRLNEQLRIIGGSGLNVYGRAVRSTDYDYRTGRMIQSAANDALDSQRQRERDQRIIALASVTDIPKLTGEQRDILASAREREARALESQRNESLETLKNIANRLGATGGKPTGGIPVSLADGEQIVRIVNEAPEKAKVSTRPGGGATSTYYNKN